MCQTILYNTLRHHSFGNFHEAGNVGTFHIVHIITVFTVGDTLFVNSAHDLMQSGIHFIGSPGICMAFCVISSPEVATPPALTALPGANSCLCSINRSTASAVHPMLETSATHNVLFSISLRASSASSSFCVAQGRAISTFCSQGFLPG